MKGLKSINWSPIDYEKASFLAREAGEEMLARLDWMTLKPKVIVDIGCGTGEMSARLQSRYPDAQVCALDHSEVMLQFAQQAGVTCIGADAAQLPLRPHSVDMIFANFMVPWHADIQLLLREWRRILCPDGLLMLTALGPDTFQEWRGTLSHEHIIPQCMDMHDLGDGLVQHGFTDPVLDVNHTTLIYRHKNKLVTELCASGVLSSDTDLQLINKLNATENNTWSVTYEVIYAHAFAPSSKDEQCTAMADGMVKVPLSHLRRQRPQK